MSRERGLYCGIFSGLISLLQTMNVINLDTTSTLMCADMKGDDTFWISAEDVW